MQDLSSFNPKNSQILGRALAKEENLRTLDPKLDHIIGQELEREQHQLTLIASENYAPQAVLEATGSVLTNKYAEGYPNKRYYAGCQYVDEVELLAIERCKELFGAEHANVQPHAGSQANLAVYLSALKPGDTILGMSLREGGHLTHGHAVNISGQLYKSVQYTVNRETEMLDYDEIERLAHEHKPKLIIAGASAYSRTIDFKRFATIAQSVGALLLTDIAHIAGLVAAGVHPSPVGLADYISSTTHKTLRGPRGGLVMCKQEYAQALDRAIMPGSQGGPFMHVIAAKAVAFKLAQQPEFKLYQQQVVHNARVLAQALETQGYRIVSGGTDNHLFIVDVRNKNVNGKQADTALEKAGIIISRSCIPFDPEQPWITSGIRIGTPAATTRGMGEKEMQLIARFIDEAIKHRDDEKKLLALKLEVELLCKQFPIY
ncbi:MAG: serine hydroxymethyltransferase [Candidatus Babeliales bacterium]